MGSMLLEVPTPAASSSSYLPSPYSALAMNQRLGVQPGLGQLGLVGGQCIAGRAAAECLVEKPECCGIHDKTCVGVMARDILAEA